MDQLIFVYHRINPSGYMDQTLEIINGGPSAVIPTLDITPIDFTGAALPAVTVHTAYGTDHGKMVVPAGERSLDVLAFTGDDVTRVVDVKVSVRAMTNVAFPVAPHLATAQALNDAGQPTTKFGPFDAVALTNPNSEAISVGVVCIIWAQPPWDSHSRPAWSFPWESQRLQGTALQPSTLPELRDKQQVWLRKPQGLLLCAERNHRNSSVIAALALPTWCVFPVGPWCPP